MAPRAILALLAVTLTVTHAFGLAPPPGDSVDFSGTWKATYGALVLEQTGDEVRGTYPGGSTLEGKVEGRRLSFRYKEAKAAGEGWFEMADDGMTFAGKWRRCTPPPSFIGERGSNITEAAS